MATFALLSDKLVGQNGEQVSRDSLKGKYVFLYFSAHWCGPCRQFTPKLVELYKKLKADPVTADKFEIVFVSSDKSSQEFDGYFKEMPWLAVPFADQQAKKKLSSKLKVKGIPSLALFNTDGTVAANNVRSAVMQDPQGKNFPWLPKSAMEILSQGTFKRNDGKDVPFTELSANQYIGLYFSAHWCPPCRQFTPKLISTYTKLKQAGKSFEIVFVSRDQEEDDYNGYFGTMPWVSLPMGDALIDELAGTFQISGIPSLIILKSDGTVVNDDACGAVGADAEGANFPWEKKPMGIVSQLIPEDDVMEALNAQVCIVLSTRGVPSDVAAEARAAFTEAAQAFHDEVNSSLDQEERVVFLTAEHEGLYDRILEVSKAQEVKGKVNLVAFNIQAGAKNVASGVQTKTDILNFAKNFHKSQLE